MNKAKNCIAIILGFIIIILAIILSIPSKPPEATHNNPAELCVACHIEGTNATSPKINTTHDVCNRCHLEDSIEGHCECDDIMECGDCHTAKNLNKFCLECH